MPSLLLNSKAARFKKAQSVIFNIDNGSGTVINDAFFYASRRCQLIAARILYTTATAGTVAAGTVSIGTTVAGTEVVAATAYENSKTVGATTALTLVVTELAAGGFLCASHTGIAATAAGEARVEVDYVYYDD